ncbi:hypothetical protein TI03_02540, partial [Achromatium sp. WMS1]
MKILRKTPNVSVWVVMIFGMVMMVGCGLTPDNSADTNASIQANPIAAPTTMETDFTEALRCMDKLFISYDKKGFVITSMGIPDHTQKVKVATAEMVHRAVSLMTEKSNALKFVDPDIYFQGTLANAINNQISTIPGAPQPDIPRYYIRGAVSQVDNNVISQQNNAGIATNVLDIGGGWDKISSIVTIDMNIGDTITRQLMPGMNATNSLTISIMNSHFVLFLTLSVLSTLSKS